MAGKSNKGMFQLDFVAADGHQSCVFCPNSSALSLADSAQIVFFHPAMGTKARFYFRLVKPMSEFGIRFVVLEQRGRGLSSIRPSRKMNYGYKELVEVDMREAIKVVKARYPQASKLVLCGHSLGGQMSVLFSAAFPEEVDAVFLVCSVSAYRKAYPWGKVWMHIQIAWLFFPLIAAVLGFHPGKQLLFGGNEGKALIEDCTRQARTGLYRLNGSKIDYEKKMSEIEVPVYGVVVKGDERAPVSALKHLIAKIYETDDLVDQNVELLEVDPKAMGVPHFAWLKDPAPVIERLGTFVSKL